MQYRPTTLQKAVIALIGGRGPVPQLDMMRSSESVVEAWRTILLNGLAATSNDSPDRKWMCVLTDAGVAMYTEISEQTRRASRYVQTCPSCVINNCVCSISVACLGDGPHSLGCHGSHD